MLFNSRNPRPREIDGVDFIFGHGSKSNDYGRDNRYAVLEVRTDLQAPDLEEIESFLRRGDAFFEGNSYLAWALQRHPRLASLSRLSIFISPLSKEEVTDLKAPEHVSLEELLTDIMRAASCGGPDGRKENCRRRP